jgi:hypothetical protein
MIDARRVGNQIRFKGFKHVEPIADEQSGPTCGFEAIENILQLFHRVSDDLTKRDLLPRALRYGVARPVHGGYSLDIRAYQRILCDYGIIARWYPFDHQQVIIPALRGNHGVLVVGDAHFLNQQAYPYPNSGHAFVLANYYTEETGYFILGYVGIDSNFARQEMVWPYQTVEAAAAWAARNVLPYPVLITDTPGNWPNTAQFYRLTSAGKLVPVP